MILQMNMDFAHFILFLVNELLPLDSKTHNCPTILALWYNSPWKKQPSTTRVSPLVLASQAAEASIGILSSFQFALSDHSKVFPFVTLNIGWDFSKYFKTNLLNATKCPVSFCSSFILWGDYKFFTALI